MFGRDCIQEGPEERPLMRYLVNDWGYRYSMENCLYDRTMLSIWETCGCHPKGFSPDGMDECNMSEACPQVWPLQICWLLFLSKKSTFNLPLLLLLRPSWRSLGTALTSMWLWPKAMGELRPYPLSACLLVKTRVWAMFKVSKTWIIPLFKIGGIDTRLMGIGVAKMHAIACRGRGLPTANHWFSGDYDI